MKPAMPWDDEREQFRLLVECARDYAIFVMDRDGRIATWNPGVGNLLGYDKAEFVGQHSSLIFTQEDRERGEPEKEILTAAREGKALDERWHVRKDGTRFWASGVVTALRDDAGHLCGYSKILRDLTERKRMEESLLREKGFADAALESLPNIFYLFDDTGWFLRWNRNLERVTGYSAEEVARLHPVDLFAGSDRELIASRIREVFVAGESTAEADLIAKNGRTTPYFFSGRRLLIEGKPCLVGMGIDISDIRASQQAVRESEARLSGIIESAMDAIVTIDSAQRLLVLNPAAERMFGYRADEVIGRSLDLLVPERYRLLHVGHVQRFGESGVTARSMNALGVLTARRKDGTEFPIEATISQAVIGGQNLYTAIVRDITERKQHEAEREEQHARDRRIAETLQRSLLIAPPRGAFPRLEIEPLYEPALDEAAVGGDFFDAFSAGAGRVALVVGDVSGKGLIAAGKTSEAKYALRAFTQEYPFPARTLSRLNRFLYETLKTSDDGGLSFIALALIIIETATGRATVSVAGTEPPLVLRASGTAKVCEIAGLPLGIDPDADYAAEVIDLEPDDTVLMTTDGLTEARAADGTFLGYEGLIRLAQAAQSQEPTLREMGDSIIGAAKAFSGGPLRDDVCLLLSRWC